MRKHPDEEILEKQLKQLVALYIQHTLTDISQQKDFHKIILVDERNTTQLQDHDRRDKSLGWYSTA